MKIYLSLGSNQGDRQANLQRAVELIGERVGKVAVESDISETEPWGYESAHAYLNQCIMVQSEMPAQQVLAATQQIERDLGRLSKTCGNQYQDRPIDIDILLYGDQVIEMPGLTIPHPLMHKRLFVLEPLTQIASDVVHPVLGKTVLEMLQTLTENG